MTFIVLRDDRMVLGSLSWCCCDLFVKVIDTTDGAEERDKRISLSMKLVNQGTGQDLDPSNAEAEADVSRIPSACGGYNECLTNRIEVGF